MYREISIIIPFYNISWLLLKACLDSILPQIDEKTELIILNDGSSEREAIETCKNYVKNYDSVYVIDRNENKGVSATRNEGISYSHGKFLIFVDADDMLEQNALRKIRNAIRENSTIDTVFYEYSLLKDENKVPCFRKINATDCKHFTLKMAERMILGIDFNSPCTIAYSKKIIDDHKLSFDTEMALGEDFKFNAQYLQLYSNGTYIKESLYLYRIRNGSATNSFSLKKVNDSGVSYNIGKNLMKSNFSGENLTNIEHEFYNLYYKSILSHILNGIIEGADSKVIKKCFELEWVRDLIDENNTYIEFPLKQIVNCKNYNMYYLLSRFKILKSKCKFVK